MRNAGLEEAQAGIKFARRNINNLRYADDTTLTPESEEELKSLLMKVKVLVTQSCPILCYPMDCSPAGSSVHGIIQAKILEWVAIPFSRGSFQHRDRTWVSCIADSVYQQRYKGSLTIYSLSLLLSQFGTSLLFHVQF